MNSLKEVLVLFSGGRDSSSVAIMLAKKGYKIKLFTCEDGSEPMGPSGDYAPDIRHLELVKAFPENIDKDRIIKNDSYLIRKLGIEKTNIEHVVYPIVLALSTHTTAISYCLKNNIKIIASGYSGYQGKEDKYIEQRKDFVDLTKEFLMNYDISYMTPVSENSEAEVKDILEQHGISSNSLENKSIFGGIAFDKEKALDFWQSSMVICKKYIQDMKND